jgi:hypothetical protein
MVRKRKRAPGAGRPPKGDFAGLSSTLSIRMPDDMRAQLEASAAKRKGGKGWSLTQELLHRAQRSFDRERDERRDLASRALCYVLAEVISVVAHNTGTGPSGWRWNPFAFRAIKLAFAQVLDTLEPKGELRAPQPIARVDPLGDAWFSPGTLLFAFGSEKTPEELAEFARLVTLMGLEKAFSPSPATGGDPVATPSLASTQQEFEFGMSQAARALLTKKGDKS